VFNRNWEEKLNAKRAEEIEKDEACAAKATEEWNNWSKQREIKCLSRKESNRQEQDVVLESVSASIDNGHPWERVMKLIDATTEPSDGGKADVSRMRKLFIQLKNEKQ
jgi:hypothetical protein